MKKVYQCMLSYAWKFFIRSKRTVSKLGEETSTDICCHETDVQATQNKSIIATYLTDKHIVKVVWQNSCTYAYFSY